MDNKAQQGLLNLNKTGYQAVSIETSQSEYGELASFIYDYRPLAGVTYDIKAMEDIVIGGTTHAKVGDVVATVITGEDGNLLNMPYLYLGKYEAIEVSAPDGYLIDPTPIPFEFTYEGQEIELVSESVTAQNDCQRLKLLLHKNEETITGWKGNLPIIEEVPANEKVFGLYTNQKWQLGDSSLPTDSLIEIVTVEDGIAVLEGVCLPQGFYYFKELDAGETHTLLDRHYEFEYIAQGHDAIQEIVLYEKEETPLLNKLHFNSFSLKKLNEEATLNELEGYSFKYKESKGAIFSLEKEDGAVIQTVTVNAESLATFNYIPVGTFFLKEQKPSSSDYLLSETIYRIESTKDGIQVFDEADELIAEQTVLEEPLFLFEVKNHLIKGTGQLTKTDIATGEPLPNTGIRLLDESMTIIYEGRTNDKGILVFGELPKGNYYFQEFEAPVGYQIDETPIPFEIKKDGEVVKCEMKNKQIPKVTLPKTGEDSSIKLYVAGVLVSMGAIALLHNKRRKEKLNNDN